MFRDSDSPKMLAYSTRDRALYAADGRNSCTRRLSAKLESLPANELTVFAEENELLPELLGELVRFLNAG